jgi:hypothetical protein
MNIRERILVEILTNGPTEQAMIQADFAKCDSAQDIQGLIDAGLLERCGPSDRPMLARGKRLGPRGLWRCVRIRREITESSGATHLPLHVMPGEGPVSTSCSAGLGEVVDTGPSPGMTALCGRARLEAVISREALVERSDIWCPCRRAARLVCKPRRTIPVFCVRLPSPSLKPLLSCSTKWLTIRGETVTRWQPPT